MAVVGGFIINSIEGRKPSFSSWHFFGKGIFQAFLLCLLESRSVNEPNPLFRFVSLIFFVLRIEWTLRPIINSQTLMKTCFLLTPLRHIETQKQAIFALVLQILDEALQLIVPSGGQMLIAVVERRQVLWANRRQFNGHP